MLKITNKKLGGYVMNDLGQKIKELRINKGLTMKEFGKLCNTEKQTVNNWEKGRNEPSPDRLKLIADMAGKSVSEFVYGVPSAKRVKEVIYMLKRYIEEEPDFVAVELHDLLTGNVKEELYEQALRESGYYEQ